MNQLRVRYRGPNNAVVEVDGHDISNMVVGVAVGARVGEVALATLELQLRRGAEVDGPAIVRLAPETEQLLKALGWTPPGEG